MQSEMVLQANNVSITFGGLRAVNEFNCELFAGELVGLIGPNGAGKTTVFN
ncbi:MAG: ATP-binding cassette domain-containing protein, partial [Treponemataceae bacterium]|nr:ATP-binding cassette domain-containing protein [Treponemataceae bacterium]